TVGEVVVAEHDVAVPQPRQEALELPCARPPRHEVAGDAHEVGLPLDDPLDGLAYRPPAARRHAEMQVREMRDAKSVERRRNARAQHLYPSPLHQSSLQPQQRSDRRGRDDNDDDEPDQTESFSVTGATETTWRLNLSSDESMPAATPTSCERCRIGIWKSL